MAMRKRQRVAIVTRQTPVAVEAGRVEDAFETLARWTGHYNHASLKHTLYTTFKDMSFVDNKYANKLATTHQ